MGSKTSTSTQGITVPPEVLARYNAVNARAETVTNRPFQQYGGEFVAPLSYAQSQGIANTMGAARMAQPYFADATNYLAGAQGDARNYYNNATGQLNQGIEQGKDFAGQSTESLNKAQRVGDTLAGQSQRALGQAQGSGSYFAGESAKSLNNAQGVGNQLAGQSYNTLGQAQGIGNELAAQSYGQMGRAQEIGNELASRSYGTLGQAQDVGGQLAGQSLGTINAAQNRADQIQQGVMGNLGAAYSGAQPFNQMAGGQYAQGLGQGQDLTGASSYGTQQALMGAQPFQQIATQFMGSGAQAVNPNELNAEQINRYMSPYLGTVLQGTAGLLNQQNQQQQSGQMGNAIRSGAFGGDRAGIAAANLSQQQNLANSKIFSDILNQGFGQALGTAQQQQQLGLGASQANRAAQQQAAQQALGIGQQGFGQGLAAAQQQGNLGQQFFGMGSTTGQNLAALGQQIYGQGTGTAQAQAALAQQQFGQGATTAAQQAALGEQQFGQGATAAAQQAALGQQQFGQGATAAERLASLGQQQFGQGATAAAQQAALGQQQFGQGATVAGQQAALGQQQFGQGATTAGQLASLGQQQFGQGATTAAQQAALGQQQFGQGLAASEQGAAIGRGIYDTGANTAAQTAAMGVSAQDAALSGAAAQMTAGQVDQATRQAENTARYNQFLQEQSLPYQQLKLASDIALGTGTASGSTTTTSQPGGFFSDERLKENIKAVGKTFDGQTIHSFNYKGDPRTQIGLIAQEVQKHHPDAVGLAGGYKTVNYDKATEDAADRGHMAYGGLASAGGSVLPQDAGQGFAAGGLAGFDPATMQQLLAAQQAMYDPIMKGNMYAGGPNAGGGLVPQSEFVARQMMTPAELPRRATSAEQASTIANLGKTINEFGEDVGAWGDKENDKENNKKKATPFEELTAEELSRSRRKQFAGGGMPYSNQMPGMGLDIPTFEPSAGSNGPMTAGALQARKSGLDKLGQVANVADTGMKLANFGKKIGLFSTGGTPYGGQGLDIPEEEDFLKKYELMTPASLQKQESGLDKVGKIAKIAGTVASIFSDKRMKENIKEIGKLFDGQIVHSFNYKGDPRTQIGLIAQEVEDHKPHAVGLAGSMKTVDYDKATSGAARRGHFAEGGMPEEMDNVPSYEPTGLYHGDSKFIRNLFKGAASGNKNIDLMSGEELPASEAEAAPANMPKPVGLAAAAKTRLPELLKVKRGEGAPKPAGLAPMANALPKNIMQIARLIRAGEGTGQNPDSTAIGPYQMLDKTFAGQFRQQYPDRARGMSNRDIIALKRSPEGAALSEVMGPKLIEGNARIIERGGFEPDAGNVYLAHFLGPDTAVKVLRANPNAPIANYVSEEAIMANRPLQENPTVGGVINWARGSMAKQAASLSRASGGLVGRNGYAVDGAVDEDPDMAFRRSLEEDAAKAREDAAKVEQAAPTGVAPPQAAPVAPATGVTAPVAPVTAPVAPSAGLAAGAERMNTTEEPEVRPTAPRDNNFFRGIAKGRATSIIPLLTGIAAMGTAPTRSLGVALATGVGAGAQAAQAQRAFGIKQGELRVAEQLSETKRMEITRGILDNRYQILSGGMVKDITTGKYLSPSEASFARQQAFATSPAEAYTGSTKLGMSQKDYEKQFPTYGQSPTAPGSSPAAPGSAPAANETPPAYFYDIKSSDPVQKIYAMAERGSPGVKKAWKDRNDALLKLRGVETRMAEAGLSEGERTRFNNLYTAARDQFNDSKTLWEKTLENATSVARQALIGSNAARTQNNLDAITSLNDQSVLAEQAKQTIAQMRSGIQEGGPATAVLTKFASGLKQAGVDVSLVENIINQPDAVQKQKLLAQQLKLSGMDEGQIQALRVGAGPEFEKKAVLALLTNIENRANGQIAAFEAANARFQADPVNADVVGTSLKAQRGSNAKADATANATVYKSHPAKGALKAGTPYKVLGDPTLHYAK